MALLANLEMLSDKKVLVNQKHRYEEPPKSQGLFLLASASESRLHHMHKDIFCISQEDTWTLPCSILVQEAFFVDKNKAFKIWAF